MKTPLLLAIFMIVLGLSQASSKLFLRAPNTSEKALQTTCNFLQVPCAQTCCVAWTQTCCLKDFPDGTQEGHCVMEDEKCS